MGYLSSRGCVVTRAMAWQAMARIRGITMPFGQRRITRRMYSVAGPNSLTHHDEYHSVYPNLLGYHFHSDPAYGYLELIRYKIVVHGFIDGYSRFITGMKASNNNKAETVGQLFKAIIEVHGLPSRARGDHGVENIVVAAIMEEYHGPDRLIYMGFVSVCTITSLRFY